MDIFVVCRNIEKAKKQLVIVTKCEESEICSQNSFNG